MLQSFEAMILEEERVLKIGRDVFVREVPVILEEVPVVEEFLPVRPII